MKQAKIKRSNIKKARLLKKKQAMRRRVLVRFLLSVSAVAVLVLVLLFSNKNITNANENGNNIAKTKYYKTIEVNVGDSLWSIASENKSGEYRTINDYIDEVKNINNLGEDEINSGEKLIIPYFE